MSNTITIHLPDGTAVAIERHASDAAHTLSDFLEEKGYKVFTTNSGDEALE